MIRLICSSPCGTGLSVVVVVDGKNVLHLGGFLVVVDVVMDSGDLVENVTSLTVVRRALGVSCVVEFGGGMRVTKTVTFVCLISVLFVVYFTVAVSGVCLGITMVIPLLV